MDRSVLNGGLLGNGGNDSRSFVAIAASAIATVALSAYVARGADADALAVANGAASCTAIYQSSAQASGLATGQCDALLVGSKFADASVSGIASAVCNTEVSFMAGGSASGVAMASASASAVAGTFAAAYARGEAHAVLDASRQTPVSGSAIAVATSQMTADNGIFIAISGIGRAIAGNVLALELSRMPIDRLMILPAELRNMEIPA